MSHYISLTIGWSADTSKFKYKRGNYLHKNIKSLSKGKILRMKTIENFQVIKRDFEKKHLGKCGGEI